MEKLSTVQFNDEENEVIETGHVQSDEVPDRFQFCLIASLWTESSFNVGAFRNTLGLIWKLRCGVQIKEIGKKIFSSFNLRM